MGLKSNFDTDGGEGWGWSGGGNAAEEKAKKLEKSHRMYKFHFVIFEV